MHTYHIITFTEDARACSIKRKPATIIKNWRLRKGVPLGRDFPPTAEFEMDKRAGEMAPDFLDNIFSLLMVSPKARHLMQEAGVTDMEYLPFVLLNKKGKAVSSEYCVANLLGGVDCLDAERSKFEMSPMDPTQIANLYRLSLRTDRIPQDKKLFRLQQMMHEYIIRSDLLALFKEHGVTGLSTLDLDTDIIL
jgi:hypothetical protein